MDYSNLGLNNRLQANNSLAVKTTKFIQGIDFNMQYEVQTKNIMSSEINFPALVKVSGGATLLGTINNLESLNTSWSLRTTPSRMITSSWYYAVYEGTAVNSGFIIYPGQGTGVLADDYRCWDANNNQFLHQVLPGTALDRSYNMLHIYNNTGTVQTIYQTVRNKYISNDSTPLTV